MSSDDMSFEQVEYSPSHVTVTEQTPVRQTFVLERQRTVSVVTESIKRPASVWLENEERKPHEVESSALQIAFPVPYTVEESTTMTFLDRVRADLREEGYIISSRFLSLESSTVNAHHADIVLKSTDGTAFLVCKEDIARTWTGFSFPEKFDAVTEINMEYTAEILDVLLSFTQRNVHHHPLLLTMELEGLLKTARAAKRWNMHCLSSVCEVHLRYKFKRADNTYEHDVLAFALREGSPEFKDFIIASTMEVDVHQMKYELRTSELFEEWIFRREDVFIATTGKYCPDKTVNWAKIRSFCRMEALERTAHSNKM
ncbi:hypothetical protein FISHEDRAFT_56297 [Fistulina hepatica ATCC 64428]|uniref:BTB domain-containing protein n=1 Tax=Fistulina hepatica ATCC 64428 TaxID=1128425 RepID=A0A0D7AJN3_9AGAR|nr:hypothetical protein FISHEDRAFT_56297 [Fistulina hepatica ATCC 64428]